ncbi:MAG TPA: AAA family ATPase [Methylomirabilota bacterium]|nr:AAA family ATPase [Methylomirabilota bacterium]
MPHSREKLATLLWGDVGELQARQSFRQALSTVRKVLGGRSGLLVQGEMVTVDPARVQLDVATFEQRVTQGSLKALGEATALYRGELLDGLTVGQPPFEDWLRGERGRLRELALVAYSKLLAEQSKIGETDLAIQTATRLLTMDPLQEAAHRSLMRLYARQGRRAAALRQYQVCVEVLRRELGVDPEPETQRAYQELLTPRAHAAKTAPADVPTRRAPLALRRSTGPADLPGSDPPLIGREPELDRLRQVLRAAGQGRGHVAVISGEAGIGKTRLLGELARDARRTSRVLLGRCYESQQILPFSPWVEALRTAQLTAQSPALQGLERVWRGEVGRLLPELSDAAVAAMAEHQDYLRLFEAVGRLLARVAAEQPLAILLEDVHWADDMSLRLLTFLSRRLQTRPILVIATARDEDLIETAGLHRALVELRGAPAFVHVELGPLSRPQTIRLTRSLTGAGSGLTDAERLAQQIWTISEGNPFVIVETVRSLHEGAAPETSDAVPVPRRVRDVVAGRLDRLRAGAAHLVAVAAVIGREFEFSLLQSAADVIPEAAAEGLEELVRRRVLHGVGERFDFVHERIREVAYQRLLVPRRRAWHGRIARALEALYAARLEPHHAAIAVHYAEAEVWAASARSFRLAAGVALVRTANRDAAALFERALAALQHLPQDADTLAQTIDIHLELRNTLWPLGELDEVLRHLREAEQLARQLGDPRRLGWVSAFMGFYLWLTGQTAAGHSFAETARRLAAQLDDLALAVVSSLALGMASHALGDLPQAEACFREVMQALTGERERERFGAAGLPASQARIWLGWCLAERGEMDEVLAHGAAAIRVAETLDHPWSLAVACWGLGHLHLLRGELDDAVRTLERGLGICRDWHLPLWAPILQSSLGHAYVSGGRLQEGSALLEEAEALLRARQLGGFHSLCIGYLGEARLRSGQHAAAHDLAQLGVTLARERSLSICEARAWWLCGDVAAGAESPDAAAAESAYLRALEIGEDHGTRPLVAECHRALGRLYCRAGQSRKGQGHLQTALTLFREMAAGPWASQVEAELRAL